MLSAVEKTAIQLGLHFNAQKRKTMSIRSGRPTIQVEPSILNSLSIPSLANIETIPYLGARISTDWTLTSVDQLQDRVRVEEVLFVPN
ncbi:unnamed protein product [Soboliphyme baturini]|uniref:Reverse transcriptase domain-containing protein n=1 Tax=Soboliphyme baturini TaxID=241478 RepID=A0A183IR40_9BILA|nr:unnamed protein product [Soboliphyme baturini]